MQYVMSNAICNVHCNLCCPEMSEISEEYCSNAYLDISTVELQWESLWYLDVLTLPVGLKSH